MLPRFHWGLTSVEVGFAFFHEGASAFDEVRAVGASIHLTGAEIEVDRAQTVRHLVHDYLGGLHGQGRILGDPS